MRLRSGCGCGSVLVAVEVYRCIHLSNQVKRFCEKVLKVLRLRVVNVVAVAIVAAVVVEVCDCIADSVRKRRYLPFQVSGTLIYFMR